MINFEYVDYLYLAGIIPVLIVIWLLSKRRELKLLASVGEEKLVKNLIFASPLYIQVLRYALFLVAFFLLITALARPYVMDNYEQKKNRAATDLVFVVDVSKSMYVKDMAPDRLSRARHLITEITAQLDNEQIGVVLFAGKASTYIPLTDDYYYADKAVDAISSGLVSQQGTSLREALKISGLIYGPDNKKTKIMCLLSDGEFHDNNAFGMADSLRKSGIKLFSFGFGTVNGGEVPLTYSADNDAVERDMNGRPVTSHLHKKELLRITGNRANNYIQVADQLSAASIFTRQLKEIEYSNVSRVPKQYYHFFLFAAFILLSAELCIPQTLRANTIMGYKA